MLTSEYGNYFNYIMGWAIIHIYVFRVPYQGSAPGKPNHRNNAKWNSG